MMTGHYIKAGIGLAVAAACSSGAANARAEHYYTPSCGSPTYVNYARAKTITYVQPSYVSYRPAYTQARVVYQSPRRSYGYGGHHVARHRYVRRAYRPYAHYSSGLGHHYRGNSHHYYSRPHYKSKHFSVGIGGFGFSYTKTKHHGHSQRSFGFSLGRGHHGRSGGHVGFSYRRHR
ncbi:MAG: hypothetical protein IIB59_06895 [Planctomycetes bacterium]|nr:hypothetical protein [Planctomycetota bacterium]